MKTTLITLAATAVLLTDISGALAAEGPETIAFKYDAAQSAETIYKRLHRQARMACDIDYSPKAQRICINGYMQEVVAKIGAPRLSALHDAKMHKTKRMREFMVAARSNSKSQTP